MNPVFLSVSTGSYTRKYAKLFMYLIIINHCMFGIEYKCVKLIVYLQGYLKVLRYTINNG